MINIRYLGHSSFYLTDSKKTSLLLDPYSEYLPYPFPQLTADIVVVSHEHRDHNAVWRLGGNPKVVKRTCAFKVEHEIPVNKTGETLVFKGIPANHDKFSGRKNGPDTIYLWEMENIKFCHLGDLGHLLTDQQVSLIGNVDVLFIPVGGKTTLSAVEASLVVNQLNPRLVFPMHYLTPEIKALGLAEDSLEDFAEKMEAVEYLHSMATTVENGKLPVKTKVIVLKFE